MAPSSKQVRTLVSSSGSVVAERVPKGTQQPFKAEMSGSKSPFHSGRRRTDVHPDVVRPVGAVYLAPSTNWSGSHILSVKIRVQTLLG